MPDGGAQGALGPGSALQAEAGGQAHTGTCLPCGRSRSSPLSPKGAPGGCFGYGVCGVDTGVRGQLT